MDDEIKSIHDNKTWTLTYLPPNTKPIGCKWVLRKKLKSDGSIERYKARLVAKGFTQKEGIDYFETFSPVTKITSIRIMFAIASACNLEIHQMDVKTAFLNGILEEEIYINQPEGYVVKGEENKVCKLNKSLYGLKQAPRQWYEKFKKEVKNFGFKTFKVESCVFYKVTDNYKVLMTLYVDDLLIFGSNLDCINETKSFLAQTFDIKDLGPVDVILGIKVLKKNGGFILTQSHFIEKVLRKFNHIDCKPSKTPLNPNNKLVPHKGEPVNQEEYAKIIGSLIYAMNNTRPDIACAIGILSRFTSNPSSEHWKELSRVLRYLKYTMHYGLHYYCNNSVLECYSDANWASDRTNSKSTSGWLFTIGGAIVAWSSKKQSCIALSSMESEFIAMSLASKDIIWMKNFMRCIPFISVPKAPITLYCDNQAAIHNTKNERISSNSKHIAMRYNHIRQLVKKGKIALEYLPTDQMRADPLTKPLSGEKINKTMRDMGLLPIN